MRASTCPPGGEQFEWFELSWRHAKGNLERVQYDYRAQDGSLFTCIAKTLAEARTRRDTWLQKTGRAA